MPPLVLSNFVKEQIWIKYVKTKIKSIRFIGNKIFSDKRLKGIISTKESKFYRILSAGDIYDPDRVNYD